MNKKNVFARFKPFKTMVGCLLAAVMMFTSSVVFASVDIADDAFDEILVRIEVSEMTYRDIHISELPDNVKLIPMTLGEFELFYKENASSQIHYFNTNERLFDVGAVNPLSVSQGRLSVSQNYPGGLPFTTITVEFFVWYTRQDGRIVDAGNPGWSLTGFTAYHSLTNTNGHSSLNGGLLLANGNANLNHYILLPGNIIRIATQNVVGSLGGR